MERYLWIVEKEGGERMKTILFDINKEDLIRISTETSTIALNKIISIFLLKDGFFEIDFNDGETAFIKDITLLLKKVKKEE